VLTFLDGVIALPEEIEARVEAELAELEGIAMPEVMSRYEARIRRRGQDSEQLRLIFMLLEQQCDTLPDEVAARVRGLSSEQLDDLGLALLRFTQLDDLTGWLDANAPAAR